MRARDLYFSVTLKTKCLFDCKNVCFACSLTLNLIQKGLCAERNVFVALDKCTCILFTRKFLKLFGLFNIRVNKMQLLS